MNILPYIRITRPSHWFKNVFIVPGILLAFFFKPDLISGKAVLNIVLGLVCACVIVSSNYVLNEILDAAFDIHHPEKKLRPIPSRQVSVPIAYAIWAGLGILGVGAGFLITVPFGVAGLLLWVMGVLYNVPPIRLKDAHYADVLSESLNNPVRLALGWYSTGMAAPPPSSIIMAYWMFGAFLMAVKRFAEYRQIGDPCRAANYRNSLSYYNEEKLLVSILFYAGFFGMMSGVFITRYRLELVLASPLVVYAMAYYLHIGFKPNSPAQRPENLFRQKKLALLVLIAFAACAVLLFYDVFSFRYMLVPRILPPGVYHKLKIFNAFR